MMEAIIRPLKLDHDLDEAHQVFVSGFHHVFYPIMDEAKPALGRDMVKICARIGNRSFVAEAEGRVVGILLGAAAPPWKKLRAGLSEAVFGFGPRAFWNRYKMSPFAKKHLRRVLIGYSPHVYKHPPSWPWAEIIVFAVHRDFRGRGLGRKLMDAFLDEVRKKGIKKATVSTDTELDWKFYPAYGFKRIVTFPLKAYTLILPGKYAEGYIYAIDISTAPKPTGGQIL